MALAVKGYADERILSNPDREVVASSDSKSQVYQAQAVISYHQVAAGETLEKIARQNEVSVEDIKVWNNLDLGHISTGMQLKIQKIEFVPIEEVELKTPEILHITFSDETLSDMMTEYVAQFGEDISTEKIYDIQELDDQLTLLAEQNFNNIDFKLQSRNKQNIWSRFSNGANIAFNSVKDWGKSIIPQKGEKKAIEAEPDIFLAEETYQMLNTASMEKSVKPKTFDAISAGQEVTTKEVAYKEPVKAPETVISADNSFKESTKDKPRKKKKVWDNISNTATVAFNSVKDWGRSLIGKDKEVEKSDIYLAEEACQMLNMTPLSDLSVKFSLAEIDTELVFPEMDNFKKVYHKVRIGETMTQIAARYNVSKNDIVRWNNLPSNIVNVKHHLVLFVPEDFSLAHNRVNSNSDESIN
jgi:LysM repeat protein